MFVSFCKSSLSENYLECFERDLDSQDISFITVRSCAIFNEAEPIYGNDHRQNNEKVEAPRQIE